MKRVDLLVVGGGAAGIFAAITAKAAFPKASVLVVEKTGSLLSKVRVSGGGRCNVTHNCFDPPLLSKNYPRGEKELYGAFHHFQPKDMIAWLEARGVVLKAEEDGRIFPKSDSSQTIIDCLLGEAEKLGVAIERFVKIESAQKVGNHFELTLKEGEGISADALILSTGSSAEGHKIAAQFGHTIVPAVPSLFTFNIPHSPLSELSGTSVDPVEVEVLGFKRVQKGPLLITHFGFSGPAILKLSAFAARFLHDTGYKAEVKINWLPDLSLDEIQQVLFKLKESSPASSLQTSSPFAFSKRLWGHFCARFELAGAMRDLSKTGLRHLALALNRDCYRIDGKTTNKEEFVTCGGVCRKEINFKTMESKKVPGLYFAGEVVNIDGITGGFNFQNAWTTAFFAGRNGLLHSFSW